jgi:regulator of RNase E activity RraA
MEVDYLVPEDPYGVEIDAMDSLRPGDVVIHSTDHAGRNAPWGELMTTVARRNGAVGCVCDSQIRDCNRIIDMGFPVFYAGIAPVDSQGRGRVMAYDVPVMCGGVLVSPGELVFADFDGVVVVPRDAEAEALRLASEKVNKETASRQAILAGKSLREVFDTYGVL